MHPTNEKIRAKVQKLTALTVSTPVMATEMKVAPTIGKGVNRIAEKKQVNAGVASVRTFASSKSGIMSSSLSAAITGVKRKHGDPSARLNFDDVDDDAPAPSGAATSQRTTPATTRPE